MKRLYIYLIVSILSIALVAGLSVNLIEPKDNLEIRSDINNLVFKCNITSGGVNIDSIRFYSDISGSWQQTGSTIFNQQEGLASFLVKNISQGTYKWNCLASLPGQTQFANTNFTFTFSAPQNIKPILNSTIPDQSWYQDTSLNNAIDLKKYFYDEDNKPQPLSFQYSGISNIIITINNGIVSFSQPLGWFGVETVYFTATDGQDSVQSNPVELTVVRNITTNPVNNTPNNTAPRINPPIPDQVNKLGDTWILNLNNYVEDDEDPKDALRWWVENPGNIVNISINNLTNKATFTTISTGENTIKFVVQDPGGLKADQEVLFKITSNDNNTTEQKIEPTGLLKIISTDPKDQKVEVNQGEEKIFRVYTSILNNVQITWYVDGVTQDETSRRFTYTPNNVGVHKISVSLDKGGDHVSNGWQVYVKESLNNENESTNNTVTTINLCGNNKTDEGENCENCPSDVKCAEGEVCKDKICVKNGNAITGFFIKSFGKITGSSLAKRIVGAVAGVIILLFIIVMIIRTRNLRKAKSSNYEAGYKKGVLNKKDSFLTIEPKKSSIIEGVKNPITHPPSGIEPIVGFINSGLASGDRPREIKKALLNSGWSRKQVKQAFKSIK